MSVYRVAQYRPRSSGSASCGWSKYMFVAGARITCGNRALDYIDIFFTRNKIKLTGVTGWGGSLLKIHNIRLFETHYMYYDLKKTNHLVCVFTKLSYR